MANAQQGDSKTSADAPPAENGQVQASNPAEDEWNEERLEQAMKTLKEMHIQVRKSRAHSRSFFSLYILQVRGLRTTIPRLLAPLTTKQPSRMRSRIIGLSGGYHGTQVANSVLSRESI